ncbi:hypothetical protein Bpfe_026722 [Biomphalaria pfeifferi]|uniref:Uncharacterized protein n=1 Tax=Biomphalaria pfeifferi TaxID=112525 RepID=A0AAD8AWR4_BIOPF|nr:hypothetical protein Bpfe_026722 [Biomphalaria pfeifferi]
MIKLKHTTFMSLNAGEFCLVITTFIWNQNILCFANATRPPGVSNITYSINSIQTTSTSKNQCCVQSKECIEICTNVTLSYCNETLNDSLVCCCNSSVSSLSANTALILSSVFFLLAICVAFAVVVLRRRKRALINSRKYTLMARFSSTKQAKDEARNNRKPVRIKSFRLVEDHCYEVVEDKPQTVTSIDSSKDQFSQYLKYIEKEDKALLPGNETLDYEEIEKTPKVHKDVFNNNSLKDGTSGDIKSQGVAPGHFKEVASTGFLSTLLNRQTEKIKRTRTSRSKKPTGFALRRTASEWHTDRFSKDAKDKAKSHGDLAKLSASFYFELEKTDTTESVHADCKQSEIFEKVNHCGDIH